LQTLFLLLKYIMYLGLGSFLFKVILFVLLTPGVLITLPKTNSGKYVIATVHGVIFALLAHLLYHPSIRLLGSFGIEPMTALQKKPVA